MQHYVCAAVRRWLWRKHKGKGSPYLRYPDALLYQHYKLWRLPEWVAWKRA